MCTTNLMKAGFVMLALVLAAATAAPAGIVGPVADYCFNGTPNDRSGNGHHGTLHNGASCAGGVLDLTAGAYLEAMDNGSLSGFSQMTVSAWYKATAITPSNSIVSKNREGDGEQGTDSYLLATYPTGDGKVGAEAQIWSGFGWREDQVATAQAITPMETGRWYHLAFTYDQSMLRLYLGGSEIASAPFDKVLNANVDVPLRIGQLSGPRDRHVEGFIEDVMIFDRALTAGEIQNLAAVPEPATLALLGLGGLGMLFRRKRK